MAAFLGVFVHFLVFRPLRHAPPLGKVVGSLGVLLYLQGIALLNFGRDRPPAGCRPAVASRGRTSCGSIGRCPR